MKRVSLRRYVVVTFGLMTDNPATCYIGYHKELSAVGTVQHTTLGLNNGSISLLVQGGKGQIILNWTGPNGFTSTSPNITNLGNGTYTVSITDGCEDLFYHL
ncbi:MAG: hypothetical protein IPP49_13255 [Saprospiraceae bacterium]|nr:hypothetical protein [Saprospiraceae bacterium]